MKTPLTDRSTEKKVSLTGSTESASINGDFYEVGVSLTNIMAAILKAYGEVDGGLLIAEAIKLSQIAK